MRMNSRLKGELRLFSDGRQSARGTSCRLTKKYYGNGNKDHKNMMITKERYKS